MISNLETALTATIKTIASPMKVVADVSEYSDLPQTSGYADGGIFVRYQNSEPFVSADNGEVIGESMNFEIVIIVRDAKSHNEIYDLSESIADTVQADFIGGQRFVLVGRSNVARQGQLYAHTIFFQTKIIN